MTGSTEVNCTCVKRGTRESMVKFFRVTRWLSSNSMPRKSPYLK